jgi:dTDP-4-dehydrorhamnose reductase
LGKALMRRLGGDAAGIDLPEFDITDPARVWAAFDQVRPELVIHAAALTNVDYCAENPAEALRVNAGGTHNLVLACQGHDVPLLYVSTNEVFDGQANVPYQEYDHPRPINPYGYSKYVGEQIVRQHLTRFYIARTAWLYAPEGTNFVHKIIARAREGGPLRVVTDEVGSPTYAEDLAEAIARLIQTGRYGTYHLVNEGTCSRYEFASEALEAAGLSDMHIEPITSDAFERPSTTPPYSPLGNVLGALVGLRLRPWQEAVAEFVQNFVVSETAP